MHTQTDLQKIKHLISQTRECVSAMLDILDQERDALLQSRSQELMDIAKSKADLLTRINSLETERQRVSDKHLQQLSFSAWLDQLSPDQSLSKTWSEVKESIKQCKMKNSSNGIISERLVQSANELMGILTGQPRAEQTKLYTANGSTRQNMNNLHDTSA